MGSFASQSKGREAGVVKGRQGRELCPPPRYASGQMPGCCQKGLEAAGGEDVLRVEGGFEAAHERQV